MKKIFGLLLISIILVSCCAAPLRYNFPTKSPLDEERKIIINKSKDEVWDKLLEGLADKFFSVNNIEKDSGFINVSFHSNDACKYVDCGSYNVSISGRKKDIPICNCSVEKHGAYYSGVWKFRDCSTSVEGRINILVQEVSENQSTMFVDTRFIVKNSSNLWSAWDGSTMYKQAVIVFDSDTKGSDRGIHCVSTGVLEKDVMDVIASLVAPSEVHL